jgi:hypothetical protein
MVEISEHAHRQWRRRSDAPSVEPELAWELGIPLDECPDFEEGRYHAHSETVLFRRGTVIVTVYDARDVTTDLRTQIETAREKPA